MFYEFSRVKDVVCVVLNGDDHGYCKVILDAKSIEWLKENLNTLEDDLTRLIVWRSLWDMVRDAKISAVEFLTSVVKHIPTETSTTINKEVLAFTRTAIAQYCPYGEWQKTKYHELFDLIINKLRGA